MRLPLMLLALAACLPLAAVALDRFEVRVLERKPQSREHFVQGLEIVDGYLYLSSGRYGQSRLLRYDFASGRLQAGRKMPPQVFAEGLTVLGDKIYQLTWQNRTLLIYNKQSLEYERALPLPGEGWGLTNDGTQLIYSDGSEQLHFVNPDNGVITRTLTVMEQGQPLQQLNELEWIEGQVWANVWQSDRIVIIDPVTGAITASINLKGLLPAAERRRGTDVLNGIARNPLDGAIWVTGKRWPWMYRIELQPIAAPVPSPPALDQPQQSAADSR